VFLSCLLVFVFCLLQPGFVNSLQFSSKGDFLIAGVGQEHRMGRWWRLKQARNSVCFIPLPKVIPSNGTNGDDGWWSVLWMMMMSDIAPVFGVTQTLFSLSQGRAQNIWAHFAFSVTICCKELYFQIIIMIFVTCLFSSFILNPKKIFYFSFLEANSLPLQNVSVCVLVLCVCVCCELATWACMLVKFATLCAH